MKRQLDKKQAQWLLGLLRNGSWNVLQDGLELDEEAVDELAAHIEKYRSAYAVKSTPSTPTRCSGYKIICLEEPITWEMRYFDKGV